MKLLENKIGVNFVKVRTVTIDLKHYLALVILKSLSVFLTILKISAAVSAAVSTAPKNLTTLIRDAALNRSFTVIMYIPNIENNR